MREQSPSLPAGILRVLVIHPETATREALAQSLRRQDGGPELALYEASTPAQGLPLAARMEPQLVLLDLTEQRRAALDVARDLKGGDCRIVGLYNPLISSEADLAFVREAVRAGVGDFLALPTADEELRQVLAGLSVGARGTARSEGRTVAFVGPTGGAGRTTLAVNTAVALAARPIENGVVLLDAHLQLGTAAALLGLAPDRDFSDLVRDLEQLDDEALRAYCSVRPQSGLLFLASPRDPAEAERISPEDMSRVLIALRRRFGSVVVDTAAHLDARSLSVLDLADRLYLVLEAVTPSVLQAARYLRLLEGEGLGEGRVQVIVNRHEDSDGHLALPLVEEHLARAVDHVVPFDRGARSAAKRGEPLRLRKRSGPFGEALDRIAQDAERSQSPAVLKAAGSA